MYAERQPWWHHETENFWNRGRSSRWRFANLVCLQRHLPNLVLHHVHCNKLWTHLKVVTNSTCLRMSRSRRLHHYPYYCNKSQPLQFRNDREHCGESSWYVTPKAAIVYQILFAHIQFRHLNPNRWHPIEALIGKPGLPWNKFQNEKSHTRRVVIIWFNLYIELLRRTRPPVLDNIYFRHLPALLQRTHPAVLGNIYFRHLPKWRFRRGTVMTQDIWSRDPHFNRCLCIFLPRFHLCLTNVIFFPFQVHGPSRQPYFSLHCSILAWILGYGPIVHFADPTENRIPRLGSLGFCSSDNEDRSIFDDEPDSM